MIRIDSAPALRGFDPRRKSSRTGSGNSANSEGMYPHLWLALFKCRDVVPRCAHNRGGKVSQTEINGKTIHRGEIMGQLSRAFTLCVLGMIVNLAQAEDKPSLFGVSLGGPVETMALCSVEDGGYLAKNEICVPRLRPTRLIDGSMLYDIAVPMSGKPDYLFSMDMSAIDGVIVRVRVATHGLKYQDEVIKALRSKFGAPTNMRIDTMQNSFGARFQRKVYLWKMRDANLTFHGSTGSIDSGEIDLASPKYLASLKSSGKAKIAP